LILLLALCLDSFSTSNSSLSESSSPEPLDDAERDPQSYDQIPPLSPIDDALLNLQAFATNLPLSSNDSTLYNPESTASVPPLHPTVAIPIGLEHSIPGASNASQRPEVAPPRGLIPSTSDGFQHPQLYDDIEDWLVINVSNKGNGNVSCSTYRGGDNKDSPPTSAHSETVISDYHGEGHSPHHCMLL